MNKPTDITINELLHYPAEVLAEVLLLLRRKQEGPK